MNEPSRVDIGGGRADISGTMRPRLVRRIFAAACGLWLALSLAEPASLHGCAMHGSGSSAHSHASHGAQRAHSTPGHERAPICTCIAGCCVTATIGAPAATSLVALGRVTLPTRVKVPAGSIAHRPAAIEFARPPTIGPPLHSA